MTDEPHRTEQLAEWIRANRAAYTPDALEAAMREQGWTPEEIAAAWRMVEAPSPTEWASAADRVSKPSGRGELALLAVLVLPFTLLALLAESSLFGSLSLIAVLGMALTVAIPVGAVIAVARRRLPLGCAGTIGLAIVVSLAVFGSCILTINAGALR